MRLRGRWEGGGEVAVEGGNGAWGGCMDGLLVVVAVCGTTSWAAAGSAASLS